MEEDLGGEDGEGGSLSGLVVDKENIKKKFDKLVLDLQRFIKQDNIELFVDDMQYYNKEALYKIRKLLTAVKECSIEFKLSRADEYSALIDDDRVEKYRKAVNDRISFINLHSNPINTLDIMNNEEVIKVIYEFIKTKISVLDLSKFIPSEADFEKFKKIVEDVQGEVKKNKNKKDIKIQKLDELLQRIFEKLSVAEFDNIDELTDELRKAYEEAKRINQENDRLAQLYGGSYAFVKTLSDSVLETKIDRSDIESLLAVVYENIKDTIYDDVLLMQGKKGFVDSTKALVTKIIIKNGLYKKVKSDYDEILAMLYVNLLNYKETI